ncbi:cyclophilin-like fold protein [Butyrivibrio sp. FCS006]|uniref:cyclophilin-like fold protein n=1 Tax=Butyrivibrio sp. FCS006 TaxID=1280684 RepID=UPI0004045437|nr:cyclophilin-like fold protein [Butyrivibrio sp. FCS006]
MKKNIIISAICVAMMLSISACSDDGKASNEDQNMKAITSQSENVDVESSENKMEVRETAMTMTIGDTKVNVDWEANSSVDALKELVSSGPLSIDMSMYGGFEQVGSIGQSLPREDKQTTTASGDIVLYSGNQLVVFYGSNSWAYTRLGHISDKTDAEIEALLSKGDVTITLSIN